MWINYIQFMALLWSVDLFLSSAQISLQFSLRLRARLLLRRPCMLLLRLLMKNICHPESDSCNCSP